VAGVSGTPGNGIIPNTTASPSIIGRKRTPVPLSYPPRAGTGKRRCYRAKSPAQAGGSRGVIPVPERFKFFLKSRRGGVNQPMPKGGGKRRGMAFPGKSHATCGPVQRAANIVCRAVGFDVIARQTWSSNDGGDAAGGKLRMGVSTLWISLN
jgi:hypothetical protein